MKFPFSAYDFFGYLASGFLFIATIEFAFNGKWLLFAKNEIPMLAFWIGVAYVVGHVIANVSSFIIEHKFLRGFLQSPEETLFKDDKYCWACVFPVFYKPFPKETRDRILQKSTAQGFSTPNRALFLHCHAKVKGRKVTGQRLSTFLNIYGFCRNMCMTGLLVVPVLVIGIAYDLSAQWTEGLLFERWQPIDNTKLAWIAPAIVMSIGMLYRYLKFFKHYTNEVYVTYAELP